MNLTKDQETAIDLLAQSDLKNRFYWTGGTLLAIKYLQHRLSEDLDFFSEELFSFADINPWVQKLKEKADFSHVETRKIHDRWELLYTHHERKLRIELVYYNHEKKTLKAREKWHGVLIDSLDDISANKTFAMIDRNEPKDLFDIYHIVHKTDKTPEMLLDLVKRKFGVEFPLDLFWSEAHKLLPLLKNIKPLMTGSEEEKEKSIKSVETFVTSSSNSFLQGEIDQ